MEIAILADTHIRDGGRRRLGARVHRELESAELILHAGDIVAASVLEDLARFAPVRAVLGNNDRDLEGTLPEQVELTLEGVRVAMVHDSGARAGRERRMRARFPSAHVVVFGHSHIPLIAEGLDGQMLINPGSPTDKRREPHFTMARMVVSDGAVAGAKIVVVDER